MIIFDRHNLTYGVPPGSPATIGGTDFNEEAFAGTDEYPLYLESAIWSTSDNVVLQASWVNSDGSVVPVDFGFNSGTGELVLTGSLAFVRVEFILEPIS